MSSMKHLEDLHQEVVIRWSKLQKINSSESINDYLYAIPNGGKRNAREAARLKTQGVKAGVSDLHLAYPNKEKHGLWIEMKKPDKKAKATPKQLAWLERMRGVGFEAHVCHGSEEAINVIKAYLAAA